MYGEGGQLKNHPVSFVNAYIHFWGVDIRIIFSGRVCGEKDWAGSPRLTGWWDLWETCPALVIYIILCLVISSITVDLRIAHPRIATWGQSLGGRFWAHQSSASTSVNYIVHPFCLIRDAKHTLNRALLSKAHIWCDKKAWLVVSGTFEDGESNWTLNIILIDKCT